MCDLVDRRSIVEEVAQHFLLIGCDGLWDTVTYDQAGSSCMRDPVTKGKSFPN